MDLTEARRILESLADGIDPETGSALEQSAEVAEALTIALGAIDAQIRRREREQSLPPNAGVSWTAADDRALAQEFDSGRSVAEIARAFGRTEGSIASRLVRIGKVSDRQAARDANLNRPPETERR